MATFKGKLKYNNIEGGVWTLETDNGEIYHLQGSNEKLYSDGKKVIIEGNIADDIMGIGMMAPIIKVKSIK